MSENLKEQPSGSNIRGLQSSDEDEKMMPNSNENSEPRAGTSRSFETLLGGHGEVGAGGGFEAISPPESQPPPLESPPPQQEQERSHNSNSMNRLMQPEGGNYHQRLALMPTLRSIFLPGLDLATPTTELFHYFVRYGELKRVTVLSNTDETNFAIVTSMRSALAANPRHLGGRMDDLERSRSWQNRRNNQNTWPMFRQGRVTRHFYNRHQAGNAVGWMRMNGSAAIVMAGNAAAGALVPYAGSGMPMMGNARSGRVLPLAVMRSSPLATGGSTGAVTGVRRWRYAMAVPLPIGGNPARSIAAIMSNAADAISPMGGNAADAAALTCNTDVVPVPPSGNTTCAEPDTPSTSTGVVSSRDINIIHTRSMTRLKAAASQLPVRRSERLHKMLSAKPPSKAAPARAPKRSRPTASKRPAKRARVAKKPEAKKPVAKKPVAKKRRQRKPSKKKDAVPKPKRKAVARKQVRKESNKNIPVERLPQWTVKPGRSVLPAAVEKEVCDVGSGGTARNLTAPRTVRQGLRQAAENNQFCPPESTKIVKKTRASTKKVVEKKKAASNGRNKKTRALKKKIVKKQEAVRRRSRSKSKARKRPVKGSKAAQVESHENIGPKTTPPPPADIGGSSQAGKSGYRASSSQIVTRAKSAPNPGPQSTFESVASQAAPQAISSKPEASIPSAKNLSSQASPQFLSNSTIFIPPLSSVAAEPSGSTAALSFSIGDIIPYTFPPPGLDSPASPLPDPRALLNPLPPVVVAPAGGASNRALPAITSRDMVPHTPLDTIRARQNSLAMGKGRGDQKPDSPPSSSSSRALQTGTSTEPSHPKAYPGLVNYSSSGSSSRSSSLSPSTAEVAPSSSNPLKKPFVGTSDEEMKRLPCFINPWPHMKAKPAGFYLETLPPDSPPSSSSEASKKSPPKRLWQPPSKPPGIPPAKPSATPSKKPPAKPAAKPPGKPLGRVNDPRLARGSLSNPPQKSIYSPKPPLPQTNSTKTATPRPMSARERVFSMPYPRAPLARIMHIDPPNRFQQPPPPPTPQRASRKPPQPAEPKRDFKLNSYTNVEANRKTNKCSPSEEDENGERGPKKKDFLKKEKKD